jgi:hypothetical protein
LFPGFSDTAEFAFFCPDISPAGRVRMDREKEYSFTAPKGGKLRVEAKLRYRKIDQFLLNFLRSVGFFTEFKGKHLSSPITDMHEDRAVIEVAPGEMRVAHLSGEVGRGLPVRLKSRQQNPEVRLRGLRVAHLSGEVGR